MEKEKSDQDLSQEIIRHKKQESILIHQLIASDIDPYFLDLTTFKNWFSELVKEKKEFSGSSAGTLLKELLDVHEKLLNRYVKVLKSEIRLKRFYMPVGHDILSEMN